MSENEVAMLASVLFGFICGWCYWLFVKPKQKIFKDYSKDRVIIRTHCGHEIFNNSIDGINLSIDLYGNDANSMLMEQQENAEKVQILYVRN